jgi:hypothetical protein
VLELVREVPDLERYHEPSAQYPALTAMKLQHKQVGGGHFQEDRRNSNGGLIQFRAANRREADVSHALVVPPQTLRQTTKPPPYKTQAGWVAHREWTARYLHYPSSYQFLAFGTLLRIISPSYSGMTSSILRLGLYLFPIVDPGGMISCQRVLHLPCPSCTLWGAVVRSGDVAAGTQTPVISMSADHRD